MIAGSSEGRERMGIANLYNPGHFVKIHISLVDPAEVLPIISSCFYLMEREDEPFQASAYLCSILLCFFPDLSQAAYDAFTELGVTVVVETTAPETERLACGISLKPKTSFTLPDSLVLLGQIVVILYKNAQDEISYKTFMEHRIHTLRPLSGVPSSSSYSNNRIPFDKANILSTTIGTSFILKKSLLQVLIYESTSPSRSAKIFCATVTSRYNIICSYLCDVVAWSGMTAIAFIYHTLWHPRSPALEQPSIQTEVRNFEEAIEKITAIDHPKYFKILCTPNETSVIEACKFPTIITLAKLIISNRGNCAYKFHASPRVSQLEKIHGTDGQDPIQLSNPSREMQYSIEIEGEFVEEVMAYGLPAGLRRFEDTEEYADSPNFSKFLNCNCLSFLFANQV